MIFLQFYYTYNNIVLVREQKQKLIGVCSLPKLKKVQSA